MGEMGEGDQKAQTPIYKILSPGDDDISSNLDKTRKNDKNASPYLDDDIVFNQLNFHTGNNEKNSFS